MLKKYGLDLGFLNQSRGQQYFVYIALILIKIKLNQKLVGLILGIFCIFINNSRNQNDTQYKIFGFAETKIRSS